MKIAMIYGEMSSSLREPFAMDKIYSEQGLTGSESSFFNLAQSLSEMDHELVVFCKTKEPDEHHTGFVAWPLDDIEALTKMTEVEVVIAWNEPDYLRFAPPGALRIMDQQLNDFRYCHAGWENHLDILVTPSKNHLEYLVAHEGAPRDKPSYVIPNSVDLGCLPVEKPARDPHRVIYCSSPDRGLHHLLSMWPLVRREVPDATLRIFYRLRPWIETVQNLDIEIGRRARYIDEILPRVKSLGVEEVGPVSNRQMLLELSQAKVFAYPCDPVRYTEGFGVSALDAAAAGCVPIVSTADALLEVHKPAAFCITGRPDLSVMKWVALMVDILQQPTIPQDWVEKMRRHADNHARQKIAADWDAMISTHMRYRANLRAG